MARRPPHTGSAAGATKKRRLSGEILRPLNPLEEHHGYCPWAAELPDGCARQDRAVSAAGWKQALRVVCAAGGGGGGGAGAASSESNKQRFHSARQALGAAFR